MNEQKEQVLKSHEGAIKSHYINATLERNVEYCYDTKPKEIKTNCAYFGLREEGKCYMFESMNCSTCNKYKSSTPNWDSLKELDK